MRSSDISRGALVSRLEFILSVCGETPLPDIWKPTKDIFDILNAHLAAFNVKPNLLMRPKNSNFCYAQPDLYHRLKCHMHNFDNLQDQRWLSESDTVRLLGWKLFQTSRQPSNPSEGTKVVISREASSSWNWWKASLRSTLPKHVAPLWLYSISFTV